MAKRRPGSKRARTKNADNRSRVPSKNAGLGQENPQNVSSGQQQNPSSDFKAGKSGSMNDQGKATSNAHRATSGSAVKRATPFPSDGSNSSTLSRHKKLLWIALSAWVLWIAFLAFAAATR